MAIACFAEPLSILIGWEMLPRAGLRLINPPHWGTRVWASKIVHKISQREPRLHNLALWQKAAGSFGRVLAGGRQFPPRGFSHSTKHMYPPLITGSGATFELMPPGACWSSAKKVSMEFSWQDLDFFPSPCQGFDGCTFSFFASQSSFAGMCLLNKIVEALSPNLHPWETWTHFHTHWKIPFWQVRPWWWLLDWVIVESCAWSFCKELGRWR